MPEGVNVLVDGPDARISFPDASKRGPALAALLATGAPIKKVTGGVRSEYVVPEGNAREAGLLDEIKVPQIESEGAPEGQTHRPDFELTHTTDGRANDTPATGASALEKEREVNRQLQAAAPVKKVAAKKAAAKKAPAKAAQPAASTETPQTEATTETPDTGDAATSTEATGTNDTQEATNDA